MQDTRLIGYARVSTQEQNIESQIAALEKYGTDQGEKIYIYEDRASGKKMQRDGLSRALRAIHPGDTLVIMKLDRLARSLKGLIEVTSWLSEQKANLVVIKDGIDTTTMGGRLVFHIMGAIAEFESDMIAERTKIGMQHKMEGGWKPGPKNAINDNPKRIACWLDLEAQGLVSFRMGQDKLTAREIMERLNKADTSAKAITSPATYRNWKREHAEALVRPLEDAPLKLHEAAE